MIKTAMYIRTSTTEQEPQTQIKDCKTLILDKECVLYEDQQSAWKEDKDRLSFNKLKKDIKKGSVDKLVVWDLDRIYRDRIKLIQFFTYCKNYKCSIYSYRQSWLNELNDIVPPFNEIMHDLMLNIMGWIAEEESTKKSDRVKKAVVKNGNVTMSYKGNKWGRKSTSTQKINKIKEILESTKCAISISEIAKLVGVSRATLYNLVSKNTMLKSTIKKYKNNAV
jgi:DNA invertase Pin-like site-specific DNA recombinase